MSENKEDKPIIGITIGDMNGVGPEVIIKALHDTRVLDFFVPVIYGSSKIISYYRKNLKADDFNYTQVKDKSNFHKRKVNVVNCWNEVVEINMGMETPSGGNYAFKALEQATSDLKDGVINALVTGPINKNNIQSGEFNFPGHTEYITEHSTSTESLMLMVSENLRIGVVTGHIPLNKVSENLNPEKISQKLSILLNSLKVDFNIPKPKVAVLGLNPHAGDGGLLGNEDEEVILPVIEEFKNKGHLVQGPLPADGFFGSQQYRSYDGILAMYHDQGLIPFKLLSFQSGVNYTAGLNLVRTSPGHGTAYNLVGKNMANADSMREALFLAVDIVNKRKQIKVSV